MTREEAIDMLLKDKEQRGECFISEALEMAIKALEQEPCGFNFDIMRNDFINKMKYCPNCGAKMGLSNE